MSKSSSTNTEFVAKAFAAYRKKNYYEAINLYTQASKLLGENVFKVNIELCMNRLHAQMQERKYPETLKGLRIATVMDEFAYESFNPECMILRINPQNVDEQLASFQPHILFIESAWHGNKGTWERKISTPSQELKSAIKWCNAHYIPTIFWNKEDPVHYETFLSTAVLFDYVFTSDIDRISYYKRDLEHNNVYLLPFACQPKSHNPVEKYNREDALCFAGAYYSRYPERIKDLEEYIKILPTSKRVDIFDRNYYNTSDKFKDYRFPKIYNRYIVGGLPYSEIEKAYKGYRYAINLNSVKQSQSMFARRIYELLACNTLVVSNFSRGVRLMFGDLVISSDDGSEVLRRLNMLSMTEENKIKAAGIRKILSEHTCEQRLRYIAEKCLKKKYTPIIPTMLVVASIDNEHQWNNVLSTFNRQSYSSKKGIFIVDKDIVDLLSLEGNDEKVEITHSIDACISKIEELVKQNHWIAPMFPIDYYGDNYLLDLALSTQYASSDIIGKLSHYEYIHGRYKHVNNDLQYRYTKFEKFPLRSSCAKITEVLIDYLKANNALSEIESSAFPDQEGFAVDPFNYVKNGSNTTDNSSINNACDIKINTGITCDKLLQAAEKIKPAPKPIDSSRKWSGKQIFEILNTTHEKISFQCLNDCLLISSLLNDNEHHYFYSRDLLEIGMLALPGQNTPIHLETRPGLNIQHVYVFFDAAKNKIHHEIFASGKNLNVAIPLHCAYFRFGIRVYGSGESTVSTLRFSHLNNDSPIIHGEQKHLLISNQYPSYDDIYRYGFVHSRMLTYKAEGLKFDVFILKESEQYFFREFQNIDCLTGNSASLQKLLSEKQYDSVVVHFMNKKIWDILSNFLEKIKVYAWIHGFEIMQWHRRMWAREDDPVREQNRRQESDARTRFWQELFSKKHPNFHAIFVSKFLAKLSMQDLGLNLNKKNYSIIHNPIDTVLFNYEQKPPEQRCKILAIRSFASKVYANDLTIAAILELSKSNIFKNLEFKIIGDGLLFDQLLGREHPLREFHNVSIEKRFLKREEIADLHKNYGIFLCPSRMDTQGVSRDEAMSSGLVPITTSVGAIPEFVDSDSAYLAPLDDYMTLSKAIIELYNDPVKFQNMSKSAAAHVRKLSCQQIILEKEVSLIRGNHER